jgi:GntR family transcriptional regulator/MocR family aminotransferase
MYLEIDKNNNTIPMYRQIYNLLRNQILSGKLERHSRLPSSRTLSQELGISRIVVVQAFEQLLAEGYIYTAIGNGTFVSDLPIQEKINKRVSLDNLSSLLYRPELLREPNPGIIDFRPGVPDLSVFPIKKWGKLYRDVCHDIQSKNLNYYNPEGSLFLRKEISAFLYRSRGLEIDPLQIIITSGAAQCFNMLAKLLLTESDQNQVIIEDPCNQDIYKMLSASGAKMISCPVDEHGLMTEFLPTKKNCQLIFTTPSHQYPMGSILSAQRRLELIEYAVNSNSYIIEDDYDSAFRLRGSPISSLFSMNRNRVIYIGTFSKTLFPALRIGYIILPDHLVSSLRQIKKLEDIHTSALEQIVLGHFIKEGLLEKHIINCKKRYRNKNHLLVQTLKKTLDDKFSVMGDSAGMHLVISCIKTRFSNHLCERIISNGVNVSTVSNISFFPEKHINELILGYGHLKDSDIIKGATIFSEQILSHSLLS